MSGEGRWFSDQIVSVTPLPEPGEYRLG
jgi:hypothetical protein